jgi:dipeptidyl aminopeptidase/acylaminoacyl peptidase
MGGNQAFASEGYAVFLPNHRAPHMVPNLIKSEAYSEAGRGPEGVETMVDDVLTGIDALARTGIIDRHRMCLYGFSNGGLSTNLLVIRTHQFRCAVSAAPILSDWPESFWLFNSGSEVRNLAGGATPWQDPQAYVSLSPVFHLDQVNTPMLLAVGDEDLPSLLGAIEMYNGLRYLGRDVTLLRYPDQGHGFTGAALNDYWDRVNAFIAGHLNNR